jgi:hypothetical protein
MDEGARTAGTPMSAPQETGGEQRSPEEIRTEIAATREEVGETVEALAEKTDVKAQAKQRVDDVKGNLRAKAGQLQSSAQGVTPQSAQDGGRKALEKAKANPAPLAVGGALLIGILIGRRASRP